jgi:hypothetical protein
MRQILQTRHRFILLGGALFLIGLFFCGPMLWRFNDSARINAQEEKWNKQAFNHYQYELRIISFATANDTDIILVEVRDNQTISIERKRDGKPIEHPVFQDYATIPKIFQEGRRILSISPFQFRASYNQEYGYPEYLFVDYDQNTTDDTYEITVQALQILTSQ